MRFFVHSLPQPAYVEAFLGSLNSIFKDSCKGLKTSPSPTVSLNNTAILHRDING